MKPGEPLAPGELVLVLGGARSGKSAFAERLAAHCGLPVLYVATAEVGDDEMAARVAAHRARRPTTWTTLEAPLAPARAVRAANPRGSVVLLDCLSMLATNLLLRARDYAEAETALEQALDDLEALAAERALRLVIVSAEVGLGVLPPSALGRQFVDLLGSANQRLAARARHVYLVVAGLGVDLRHLATGEVFP
jgi:adenosylcobinamide kinase/adenosylcobinamide-phosphate guanylyltransferase